MNNTIHINLEECYRLVSDNNKIQDQDNNFWIKITATGYKRIYDDFFWPFDPRNTNNPFDRLPPSINEIKMLRR